MKEITMFYIDGCPYCRQANRALEELAKEKVEYSTVSVRRVNENKEPEMVKEYTSYDGYYYVPTMYVGKKKIYEAKPSESYEECKNYVRKVLDNALANIN